MPPINTAPLVYSLYLDLPKFIFEVINNVETLFLRGFSDRAYP